MKNFPTHIVTAAGVVENDNGEILMVNAFHGGWVFPGGQVEIGENLIDAVTREIKEESGIDVIVDKLFCVSSNTSSHKGYNGYDVVPTKVMFDFICKYKSGNLRGSDENSESAWIKKDEVLNYIKSPAIIERFKAYLEFDGNVKYYSYIAKPEFVLHINRNI